MGSELVSIISPVYNAAETIEDMLHSVLNQSYPNWELILVDDCSTDNSVALINPYLDDPRIKLLQNESNLGPAKTRNRAIEAATGRFIAFLDSDDMWLPGKLEKQVAFMLDNGYVLSHTAYAWMDAGGHVLDKIISAPEELDYEQMLDFNYIGCLTGMYDAGTIGKYYMPDILKRQDYGLWLSIMRAGHKAYFLNEVLAYYRTGRDSVSSNKFKTVQYNWYILRQVEKQPFFKSLGHFMRYAITGLKKYQ